MNLNIRILILLLVVLCEFKFISGNYITEVTSEQPKSANSKYFRSKWDKLKNSLRNSKLKSSVKISNSVKRSRKDLDIASRDKGNKVKIQELENEIERLNKLRKSTKNPIKKFHLYIKAEYAKSKLKRAKKEALDDIILRELEEDMPIDNSPELLSHEIEGSIDKDEMSANRIEIPLHDIEMPIDDIEIPIDEDEMSEDRIEIPKDDIEIPKDDIEIPKDDIEIPKDDIEIPKDDIEIPKDDIEIPKDEDKISTNRIEIPRNDAEILIDNTEIPIHEFETSINEIELPIGEPLAAFIYKDFGSSIKGIKPQDFEEAQIQAELESEIEESGSNFTKKVGNKEKLGEEVVELIDESSNKKGFLKNKIFKYLGCSSLFSCHSIKRTKDLNKLQESLEHAKRKLSNSTNIIANKYWGNKVISLENRINELTSSALDFVESKLKDVTDKVDKTDKETEEIIIDGNTDTNKIDKEIEEIITDGNTNTNKIDKEMDKIITDRNTDTNKTDKSTDEEKNYETDIDR
ncbi:uncharacterized protein CMU_037430 [Cryptosporidium muris RN66]|uniref:Uncharacterized protein n=1 Tax=Cryptosporidium muris (strain RN66) TaxID=441375 RepID=B6AH78_CRYMR|nr:uncharacterized protein CMU_037430 [Cryptosporidium muris RN66]EEA07569.1 hypothetical protein CMU_037430 [Cryptosporidium muris RN66]|eukprot:XP_002141918.1 hypothetical protein [Cryptosporidium muris RN66]